MDIKIEPKGKVTIIALHGNLDGITAAPTFEKIEPLVTPECRLVINMTECHYVSSAGLRTILMLGKKIKSVNGQCVMAGLQSEVKDVMEMTGFSDIFVNYDSEEGAIAAIMESAP